MSSVNNTLNAEGGPIETSINESVTSKEILDALIKSAGSKLPVYLDIETQSFMVDSKIANVGVVQGDSALDLTAELLAKVRTILEEKKQLKKAANNAKIAATRKRDKYVADKRLVEQSRNQERAAEKMRVAAEEMRRKQALANQRKFNANLRMGKQESKEDIAAAERAAAAAARAAAGPSWFQRTFPFGKKTLGGKRKRTHKRRA